MDLQGMAKNLTNLNSFRRTEDESKEELKLQDSIEEVIPLDIDTDEEVESVEIENLEKEQVKEEIVDSGIKLIPIDADVEEAKVSLSLNHDEIDKRIKQAIEKFELDTVPFETASIGYFVEDIAGYEIFEIRDAKLASSKKFSGTREGFDKLKKEILDTLTNGLIYKKSLVQKREIEGETYFILRVSFYDLKRIMKAFSEFDPKFARIVKDGETVDYQIKVG